MQDAGTVLEVLRERGKNPVAKAAQSLESPAH
jgi:hypothetical protein